MAAARIERRPVAILAAAMVGRACPMERDEAGAHRLAWPGASRLLAGAAAVGPALQGPDRAHVL